MTHNTNTYLLVILVLIICACIYINGFKNNEGFVDNASGESDILGNVHKDISELSEAELKETVTAMRNRLAKYGLVPGLTDMEVDRSQYVPKSALPPAGPRIDMSQYVKKSSIPPEKVCPPQKEIDYSQYVKKSTLPPAQKCPPCVAPKVKVSAGLCKKCPPCPKCPPPTRCPTVTCPEPKPVEQKDCPKCTEIKYIKVPTIITRTVKVDSNNNVIEESQAETTTTQPLPTNTAYTEEQPVITQAATTTTQPPAQVVMETPQEDNMAIPEPTRNMNSQTGQKCNVFGLNSEFKLSGGPYGMPL